MSKQQQLYKPEDEQSLMTEIWSDDIALDPEAFVMFAFPWGQEGTPLHSKKGPKKWQREELRALKDHIHQNRVKIARGEQPEVYKFAMTSGRGPGKSTLVAWLILFAMSTVLGGSVVVTANTEDQLKDKTWAELGKWHTLAINRHWFEKTALSLRPAEWFGNLLKDELKIDTTYYYAKAQLWSEENPDAFAGLHNQYGILLIFDEASGIPAPIWKVSEGFFTDPVLHRYHFVFSNPRRNTGPFFECFHKSRARWRRRQIDSREVEDTDKKVLNDIIEDYGEDSDEARVEVKGQFPRQGDKQFISNAIVQDAIARELIPQTNDDTYAPLILGVDVARFGDDSSVLRWRQGRNGRVIPPIERKGLDNMQLADLVAAEIHKHDPDAIFVDSGNGTGVIDRLRQLGYKVIEVSFGGVSPDPQYGNMRTYMWAMMRDWIREGLIDDDPDLQTDLTAPEYRYQRNNDKIILESKEDLKSRGFSSPDNADALACTFAAPVATRHLKSSSQNPRRSKIAEGMDYDPFS